MTADISMPLVGAARRVSRTAIPRSRGALSGGLVMLLGGWAAAVSFIGPYFSFAFTPEPSTTWHWTAARGWLEVLPGGVVFLGGALLLASSNRITSSAGGWLAVAGGGWLLVGPSVARPLGISLGSPDPASSSTRQAAEQLFFFYATGGAIVLLAAFGLGRLSLQSVRDVEAAVRRAEADQIAPLFGDQSGGAAEARGYESTARHERPEVEAPVPDVGTSPRFEADAPTSTLPAVEPHHPEAPDDLRPGGG